MFCCQDRDLQLFGKPNRFRRRVLAANENNGRNIKNIGGKDNMRVGQSRQEQTSRCAKDQDVADEIGAAGFCYLQIQLTVADDNFSIQYLLNFFQRHFVILFSITWHNTFVTVEELQRTLNLPVLASLSLTTGPTPPAPGNQLPILRPK